MGFVVEIALLLVQHRAMWWRMLSMTPSEKSTGLESKEAEKARFSELADRLAQSKDPGEREQLKKDLARMTFGGE